MTHELKVFMHRDLVDELDDGFSPMDGLVAIGQMFDELPRRHAAIAPKHPRRRAGRKLRVYRGRYDWYPLGFSYVQIANALHVLELWIDDEDKPNRRKIDVILSDEGAGIQSFEPPIESVASETPAKKTYVVTVEVRTVDLYEVQADTADEAMENWQDGELRKQGFSKLEAKPVSAEEKWSDRE